MGKVIYTTSISLDGFVAGPNDEVDQVFKWMLSGDTDFPLAGPGIKISRASIDLLGKTWPTVGAVVSGRRVFDLAEWGDDPPLGLPQIIMTHNPPQEWIKPGSPYTFVTDGIASAIRQAKQAAGDKHVEISTPNVMQQALNAGLLDEIHLNLAHVLIGEGIRLFDNLASPPIDLERLVVVEGTGVTHLQFRVVK